MECSGVRSLRGHESTHPLGQHVGDVPLLDMGHVGSLLHGGSIVRTEEAHAFLGHSRQLEKRYHLKTVQGDSVSH